VKQKPWSETEIATVASAWLAERGFDCYPEAQFRAYSARADIAGVQGKRLGIVEAKISGTIAVLDQAARWLGKAHFVWIATPTYGDTFGWACRTRGIGIIGIRREHWPDGPACIDDRNSVPAPLHRFAHAEAQTLIAQLHPDMKRAVAGSASGRSYYSTPFSRTIEAAKAHVAANPGCTMHQVVQAITHHYAHDASARGALANWVDRFARRADDGRLYPLDKAAA